jgi:DNA-directed RNA polymerase subunit L
MELKVVKEDKGLTVIEIPEETVTVTNVIRGELWDDANVKEAAQIKEHPYLSSPKIFVKTSRGKPTTALKKASDSVIKQTETFQEEFKKAIKK